MFEQALEGILPEAKTQIPSFLTSEILLEIIEKVMIETTKQM